MCGDCHTPRDEKGQLILSKSLQGAPLGVRPIHPMPWADTAPAIAGLPANYTAEQLGTFLQTGKLPEVPRRILQCRPTGFPIRTPSRSPPTWEPEEVRTCCLAVVLSLLTVTAARAAELKIATWNLNWLTSRQDGLPSDVKIRRPEDFDRLREYAAELNADVVAIEEVDNAETAYRLFPVETYSIHIN